MIGDSGVQSISGRWRWALLFTLLTVSLALAGCEAPWSSQPVSRPAPDPTPTSSLLANQTIYWNQNTWLTALRTSDGKPRWQTGHWTRPCASGSCSSTFGPFVPTLVNDTLYASGINDQRTVGVYAIAAGDGARRWQTPIAGCLPLPVAAPLVSGGVVYVAQSGHSTGDMPCGPSGWVYALRASDGKALWRVPFERVVWPNLALTNGVLVVANATYPAEPEVFSLTGLRASDGKHLWRVSRTRLLSSFTAANGVVITSGHASARYASGISVEAFRASDGAHLWESVVVNSGSEASAPLMANGMIYVYGGDGYLYALRASDGRITWRFQTGMPPVGVGVPAYVNGRLYLGVGRSLDVLDTTSGTLLRSYIVFDPVADSDRPDWVWSAPVVTDSTIFVSAGFYACPQGFLCHLEELNGKLYALDVATGNILWQYQSPQGYQVTPPVLGV